MQDGFFIGRLRDTRGFTLVEVVLSWVILGIIALTIAIMLSTGVGQFELISSRKETLANARVAVDRIIQELLPIKTADLISLSINNLQFRDATSTPTSFRAEASGGVLRLYRTNSLLADNLSSFTFTYYDAAGNVMVDLSDLASLRRIKVDIGVVSQNGNPPMNVRGEVYPRNFYYSNFQ